jgi:uncharacterized membrane protein YfcA
MTPILLLFFGVAPATAVATDLWFAAITKIVGARIHHRAGNVDWQIVFRLWTGSLPAAMLTVALVTLGLTVAKVAWLTKAIGVVVMITAVGLLLAPLLSAVARRRRLGDPDRFKAVQPRLTVIAGATLGILVALTSIGAGALGSVMLLYLYPLRMTPHRLVATDLVHAVPLAMVAGTGYLLAGLVDGEMLLSLLVGSLPAIAIGSFFSRRCPASLVRIALALVLGVSGIKAIA